jgi:ELWxxDGT repeat protein
MVAMNDSVFFIADDGVTGRELWTSAGTAATTFLLRDIWPGINGGVLTGLTVANGRLFFAASDSLRGYEVWTTDGTIAGTTMLDDMNPGFFAGTRGRPIAGPGGTLYLEGNDGISGFEPYKMEDSFAPYGWGGRLDATPAHAVVVRFNEGAVEPRRGGPPDPGRRNGKPRVGRRRPGHV